MNISAAPCAPTLSPMLLYVSCLAQKDSTAHLHFLEQVSETVACPGYAKQPQALSGSTARPHEVRMFSKGGPARRIPRCSNHLLAPTQAAPNPLRPSKTPGAAMSTWFATIEQRHKAPLWVVCNHRKAPRSPASDGLQPSKTPRGAVARWFLTVQNARTCRYDMVCNHRKRHVVPQRGGL